MSKSLRAVLYAIGLGVALGLLFLAFVLPNRESGPDGVDGNFSVGGVSRDDALGALRDLEVRLANSPIRIKVEGTSFELIPATIGFDFDEESVLDSALEATSPDSVIEAAEEWDGDGGHAVSLSIMATFDEAALFSLLDRYDLALEGPFEGGIALEGTTPIAKYSRPGLVIDRLSAGPLISSALVQRPRPESVTLNIIEETPILSVAAVDAALDEAILLLGGRITLTRSDPDVTLFLSVEQLARALMTRVEEIPSPHMVVTFDPVRFDDYLHPVRAGFESPPVDARFIIDDDENITIIPGFPGARIDTDLVVEAAEQAARRATRTTVLPLDTGVAPTISTEYLLSLGVKGKISEFTTEHPCCRPRVNNIQLFADAIDGRMVLPGEVVSLNETVGKRTPEKGYRPAPTIIKGEITDTVGGGVSQFATTFYNAVFWAGLEIIEHQPHSYYFSRYPEGIEATISWQKPDLVFRNDSEVSGGYRYVLYRYFDHRQVLRRQLRPRGESAGIRPVRSY